LRPAKEGFARVYLPYLMYGYAATLVLMLAGCGVMARTVPGLRGVRLLGWALAFGLLGVVLVAMRTFAPAWATILLAQAALFVSSLLIYGATADTLDVPAEFVPWGVAIMAAACGANTFFTYVHPDLPSRILICSACFAIFAGAKATMLFQYREPAGQHPESPSALRSLIAALAWLQMLVVILQILRGIVTVFYPPAQIVHMDVVQSGFTYMNLMLNSGSGCGLIWLALSIHRRDLHRMAQTDGLTGLLNRRAFEEILARELVRSNEIGKSLAVLQVDIDRFKQVNDRWGHQAGDEVIRRVSDSLRKSMRPTDALSRFGGEEFMILLREVTADQSGEIAGRLRAEIAGLTELPGEVRLTVSIGVAASHPHDTPEELLRRCDEALYRSKRGGRNLVTVDRSAAGRVRAAQASA
jgi:diguanylate cyclase (GGDEF)-like protein